MSAAAFWPNSGVKPLRRSAVAALLVLAAALAGAVLAPSSEAAGAQLCQPGQFCAWAETQFGGRSHSAALDVSASEQCIALPADLEAQSFVNNTGHPVTVYQDPVCDTQAEFHTYPSGSYVPHSSYVARAIKVWSH